MTEETFDTPCACGAGHACACDTIPTLEDLGYTATDAWMRIAEWEAQRADRAEAALARLIETQRARAVALALATEWNGERAREREAVLTEELAAASATGAAIERDAAIASDAQSERAFNSQCATMQKLWAENRALKQRLERA